MMRRLGLYMICWMMAGASFGQILIGQDTTENRVITSAVPFLSITPDARSGGMGDVGVAISPDANAVYWNPAKLVYMENTMGGSLSYTPWLGKVFNDMSISYLSGFYKPNREQAFSFALKYFDLGDFQFTDENNVSLGDHRPREFSIDAGYSRMLSEEFSIGLVLKYIHSNLTGNFTAGGIDARPGNTVAGDLGVYYKKDLMNSDKTSSIAFAGHVSNIGGKVTYSDESSKDFLPAKIRLGSTYSIDVDPLNSFSISMDLNKLLVPSPPIRDASNNIIQGKDPDRSMLSGVFGSFTDAPDGFSEEMKEFMLSIGAEYWYNQSFAARAGYFTESEMKGDRQYFTFGVGLRYQVFGIDFAYLVPMEQEHPLAETLRFTIHFNFENKSSEQESVTDQ